MIQKIRELVRKRVRSGSSLWYALWHLYVLPKRLRERKSDFVRSYLDYYRVGNSIRKKFKNKELKNGWVTVVITSAGRKKYLEPTIESLKNNFIFDEDKVLWYLIDDYPDSAETRDYIKSLSDFDLKIFNDDNLGQGRSLNKIYAEVETEFIFHCQDDWLFLRPVPVEQMINVLRENPRWRQLLLFRTDGEYKGEFKDLGDGYAEYHHKFSFNPHLVKTEFFINYQPFPLNYTETEYNLKLERNGQFVSGVLGYGEAPYIKHLGLTRKTSNL